MSTNRTSLWGRIEQTLFGYQEWIEGAVQDRADWARNASNNYQENVDRLVGSYVNKDAREITTLDRIMAVPSLFKDAGKAAVGTAVSIPLAILGCNGSDVTTTSEVADTADTFEAGSDTLPSIDTPVGDETPVVPQPDTLPDTVGPDTVGPDTVGPDTIGPDTVGPDTKADMDDDGILDNIDNCPNIANQDQEDADADGIGDVCDNCPEISNPDQLDTDANGIGNACEAPPPVDTDGDGVVDEKDNCPAIANSNQEDADADGIGDVCDNCPEISNPDQLDTDANGIGNACEAPPPVDTDGDGVVDEKDNCPAIANLNQEDADADGVGDACEVYITQGYQYCIDMTLESGCDTNYVSSCLAMVAVNGSETIDWALFVDDKADGLTFDAEGLPVTSEPAKLEVTWHGGLFGDQDVTRTYQSTYADGIVGLWEMINVLPKDGGEITMVVDGIIWPPPSNAFFNGITADFKACKYQFNSCVCNGEIK